MDLPIPSQVIYAGLGGCVLALIVATIQQKWQVRVFFILALRLAIGWHFAFEGMHKIHSHMVGVTETSRPFSSEPYFRESEGPIADLLREKYLDDPEAKLFALVQPSTKLATVGDFLGSSAEAELTKDFTQHIQASNLGRIYAGVVPKGTNDAAEFFAKAVLKLPLGGAGGKFLGEYPSKTVVGELIQKQAVANLPPEAAKQLAVLNTFQVSGVASAGKKPVTQADLDEKAKATKVAYGRWALGLDAKDVKKKYVSGDVAQTVPTRLTDYENRKKDLNELKARREVDLGRKTLFDKIALTKTDMLAVRTELVKDAESMIADAKTDVAKLAGAELPKDPDAAPKPIEALDQQTMWILTGLGVCLIIGLGTRLAAVVGAGFLVMTYLTYPPFPWLPNPPGTEGNPVFVNKNAIEALALLVIASMPTGRWLGVDAIIYYILNRIVFGTNNDVRSTAQGSKAHGRSSVGFPRNK